jgi:thiamine pyrophosphate-dependent acetolactate synthase large subunit-like protein
LAQMLQTVMTAAQKKAAAQRARVIGDEKSARLSQQKQKDHAARDSSPLCAARFMEDLSAALPKESSIFDESLTSSPELTRYLTPRATGEFFQTRGGSLGVGFPGAIGVKLAQPERTVVGFSGDGGSMYTIQALWTAARYSIDAKFVVCNNQSYKLLKLNIQQYWKEQSIGAHRFPNPFELTGPVIDFAALAGSMGVPGMRVERAEQAGPAIQRMLGTKGPFLIDLVVPSQVPGDVDECKCGQ